MKTKITIVAIKSEKLKQLADEGMLAEINVRWLETMDLGTQKALATALNREFEVEEKEE